MSLLIDPNKSLFNIETYYIENIKPNGHIVYDFIRSKEEMQDWQKKGYAVGNLEKPIQRLVTTWKRLSWKEYNSVSTRSMTEERGMDGQVKIRFDPVMFREVKFKTCLKSWDFKDETGQVVAINEKVIDMLDPTVAEELLNSFEKLTELSGEESKK